MKLLHYVALRVFCKEGEDENQILGKLKALVPFDLEKERIAVQRQVAIGFEEKKIIILEIIFTKERHTAAYLESLKQHLRADQKQLLVRQADSRLDNSMNFFIRFDKDRWLQEDKLWVIDGGNCFHLKMNIAMYPAKREKAMEKIKALLGV